MRSKHLIIAAGVAASALVPGSAVAQSGAPTIRNPPVLQPRAPTPRLSTMLNVAPKTAAPSPDLRDVVYDLNVTYTQSTLYNPTLNRQDNVKLRSYQGTGVNPNAPFVGPQLEIYPGQTVRMNLNNQLPPDTTCPVRGGSANVPHCFNGTNMHTHGLWINPSGNSDNVLISVNPGVNFQYEYNIPPDHPAGTYLVSLAPARLDGAAGVQRHGRSIDRARHASADAIGKWRSRHAVAADPQPAIPRARDGVSADPVCLPRQQQ